jgi:CBS domain containing-hemolysin-like protein
MEIAFISSNKLRFELEKSRQSVSGILLSVFYRHPEQFITTTLVGNNVAIVVFSITTTTLLDPYLSFLTQSRSIVTVIETVIAAVLILFTGEFIPKTIFRTNPNLWLRLLSPLFFLFYILLYPIAMLSTWMSVTSLRIFGVRVDSKKRHIFSRIDLGHLLQESIDRSSVEQNMETEVKIFKNALDFSSVRLRDCIVPRTEIVAIDMEEATLEHLKQLFISTGHSKILIYKDNIDNIIGYIHSSEMLRHPESWTEYINQVPIVPESMPASRLMKSLNQQKKSLAVVVDEFGGTTGIVTLEDILEEIFGEIEDEHDKNALISRLLDTNEYLLSGRLEIDAVNEQFGLSLPESADYTTVAGFILHYHQNIPGVNDVVKILNYTIRILKVDNHRIDLVKLLVN